MIWLLVLSSISGYAQDKAMLTKEETINYISKKLDEVRNYKSENFVFIQNNISVKDAKAVIKWRQGSPSGYASNCGSDYFTIYTGVSDFNLIYINEIKDGPDFYNGNIGSLILHILPKTGFLSTFKEQCRMQSGYDRYGNLIYKMVKSDESNTQPAELSVFYNKSDPSNFQKLKKAFEHLKALCKAEDDPFGN